MNKAIIFFLILPLALQAEGELLLGVAISWQSGCFGAWDTIYFVPYVIDKMHPKGYSPRNVKSSFTDILSFYVERILDSEGDDRLPIKMVANVNQYTYAETLLDVRVQGSEIHTDYLILDSLCVVDEPVEVTGITVAERKTFKGSYLSVNVNVQCTLKYPGRAPQTNLLATQSVLKEVMNEMVSNTATHIIL